MSFLLQVHFPISNPYIYKYKKQIILKHYMHVAKKSKYKLISDEVKFTASFEEIYVCHDFLKQNIAYYNLHSTQTQRYILPTVLSTKSFKSYDNLDMISHYT